MYDGATTIGTQQALTTTTTSVATNTFTRTPTLAQLQSSTFKIRVSATRAGVTQSATFSVDYVDVTVDYTAPVPSITQAAYRFYDEAGTESGATALAAQDTAITADLNAGVGYGQLRVRLQSTTAVAVDATDDFTVQYERNASGTWINAVGETLLDSYSESNVSTYTPLRSDGIAVGQVGQSFLGNGQKLTRLQFYIKRVGTVTGNLTAGIYAHSSGTFGSTGRPSLSTDPFLTTATAVVESTISTTESLVSFYFNGTFTLANGTPYIAALKPDFGDASNHIAIGIDTTSPTHAGNSSNFASGGWNASNTQEYPFYVYTGSTGGAVVGYNAAGLTEGQATTNRLTGGTGSFVAGKVAEDSVVDDLGWAGNNYTELVYALQINGSKLVNGDTLRFRVVRNGATTGMTYTATPTINVVSSATFTPVVLDTLAAWLDPVDPAPFSLSGTEILTWNDKGPNAYQATASALTSTQRPNRTGTMNGKTTVTFDGGDWLRTNIPATLKPFTFATVINMTAGTTDRSFLGSSAAAAVGDGGWQMRASFTTDEFCLNTSNTAEVIRSSAVPEGTPTLIVLTYSATGAWTLRYNGAQVGSGTNNLTPTADRFHLIGNNSYTSVVESFTGQMGDIVLCNDVLVGADLTDLESYLSTKWLAPAVPVDLVVASAAHAHAADNVTVTEVPAPVNLVVQDASHSHLSQQPAEHYLTATTGYATTPDPGTLTSPTVWSFKIRGPTGAATAYTIAQQTDSSGTNNQWLIARNKSTGEIHWPSSTTGSNNPGQINGSTQAVQSGDEWLAISVNHSGSMSIQGKFSTNGGQTWTNGGSDAFGVGPLFDSSAPVTIGRASQWAAWNYPDFPGRIYWVECRTGTDPNAGTVVWRFDASEHVSGTSWVDVRGRTWTLSNASAVTHVTATDVTLQEVPAVNLVVQNAQHAFAIQTDSSAFLASSYLGRGYDTVTTPDPGPLPTDGFVFVSKVFGPIDAARLGLVAQYGADGNRSFHLERYGSLAAAASKGDVRLTAFPAGTTAGSSSLGGDKDTQTVDTVNAEFFATSYNATTGAWRTLLSTNGGTSYAQVASGTTTATGFFDSSDVLRIGGVSVASGRWVGLIYWVELRTGNDPQAGTLLWRFDVNEHVSGTNWTDARGRTWTVSQSATSLVHPNVTSPTLIEIVPTVLVVDDAFHAHSAEAPTVSVTFNLTVQDGVHAHAADSVTLDYGVLAPANAAHAHSAEAPTLYAIPLLVVADGVHAHSAANVAVDVVLVVQSATHAHSSTSVTVDYVVLAPASATHAHTAANIAVDVVLVAQSAAHAHVADNVVTNYVVLTVAAATHAHSVDNVVVGVDLVVQSATHTHSADNVVTNYVVLAAADAAHVVSSDTATLQMQGDLAIQSTTHAHSADNLTFALVYDLVVQGSVHGHTATNVALVVDLAVQGAAHAHIADVPTLQMQGDLAIQSASHVHSVDNVALTQLHVLTVDSSAHALTSETPTLYPVPLLVVAAGVHAHTAANVALVVDLVVQSSLHGHTAANVTVVVDLAVANATHAHSADNVAVYPIPDLIVAAGVHAHTAVSPTLVVEPAVQSGAHVVTSDNVIITPALLVNDARHLTESQEVSLSGVPVLVVQPSVHAHVSDNVAPLGVSLAVDSAYHRITQGICLDSAIGSVSTPDPGLPPSPDFTVVARVTDFTDTSLVEHGVTSPNRGMTTYFERRTNAEDFVFTLSSIGSNGREHYATGPRRNREYVAYVMTLSPTYTMTPYTSVDGVTWEIAAAKRDWGSASTAFDTTADLVVGSSLGYNGTANGRIHWVEMRSGLDPVGGAVVWRMDARDHVSGTSWTDSRSRTWTLSNPAALVPVEIKLLQVYNLAVQAAVHAHSADNAIITPGLLVADAYHGHTASHVSPVADLVVQAAAHAVASDAPTLVQTFSLTVASAAHAHSAAEVTLTQTHVLAVAASVHAHNADHLPTFTGELTLVVAAAVHVHSVSNVALTQQHVLAIDSAEHAHSATDQIVLTGVAFLAVQAAYHLLTSDEVDMRGLVILNNALAVYLDGIPASRVYAGSALVWS